MNPTTTHRAASGARQPAASTDYIAEELRRYDEHLSDVRGLAAGTRQDYLFNWIKGPAVQSKIEEMCDGTTNQIELSRTAVAATRIPLAPVAEQTRIADQLDKLLARIQACNDRIDAIPALLKRFRQAVLTAATSGALTEDWRIQHEARVARMEPSAESGNCVRDSGQRSYQVTPTPDSAKLHPGYEAGELIENGAGITALANWRRCTIGDVLQGKPRNGYSPKSVEFETPVRSLTLSATTSGRFFAQHSKFIDEHIPENSHLWLETGDILIQRANSLEYVGVSAIFDGPEKQFIYPDLMMKCRPNELVRRKFLFYMLSAEGTRKYFRDHATGTAGNMPKINQQTVISAPIALPPLVEQDKIVQKIDTLFLLADRIESRYKAARAQVQRLTPLLLAKAFRGELVPQDPNDEPAAELLTRINARRGEASSAKIERSRKTAPSDSRGEAMLTKLHLKNFKAWKDTGPIRLAPLTVIFGANSAGKSSLGHLLLALKQTAQSTDRKRALHLGDASTLIDLGTFGDCMHGHDLASSLDFDLAWSMPKPLEVRDPLQPTLRYLGDKIGLDVSLIAGKSGQPEVRSLRYDLSDSHGVVLDVAPGGNGKPATGKAAKLAITETSPLKAAPRDRSFAEWLPLLPPPLTELLSSLEGYVFSLGDDVQRKELRLYLAFKRLKNFATVIAQKNRLVLYLHLNPKDLEPLPAIGRDVSQQGHWGTGDVELSLTCQADLDMAKPLILMSYQGRGMAGQGRPDAEGSSSVGREQRVNGR